MRDLPVFRSSTEGLGYLRKLESDLMYACAFICGSSVKLIWIEIRFNLKIPSFLPLCAIMKIAAGKVFSCGNNCTE